MPEFCVQGCAFFQPSPRGNATLLNGAPLVHFTRNHAIYSEGDSTSFSYRVVEGAVRLSRILTDGHRQVLDILLPNDTFGITMSETCSETAEAIGEVVLLRCKRACIMRESEKPGFGRLMVGMLSRSLNAAQDHIGMLGHQGAKERVASFLLRLMGSQNCGANQPIELAIGRQDMADYLGLTIETVCRTLSDLKASGIIAIPNRHQIAVRNKSRLEAVAENA
jgi:CRP/FNR family nitrogen fixation transcriptional regulator